jgi:hypothetical protein
MVLLPFLIISALTGFFRANHKWFWKEGYKKVKNQSYDYALSVPKVPLDSIFSLAGKQFADSITILDVSLRKEISRSFYEVRLKDKPPLLLDADNGKVLSPITPALAEKLATQYVAAGMPIKAIRRDDEYRTRKEKKLRPVYVIEFADNLNTQILLDVNTGAIEEEVDDNLRFGFWMVKLHDYDFWTLKRALLSFAGLGLTIVGFTGLYLWLRKNKTTQKKSRRRQVEASLADK